MEAMEERRVWQRVRSGEDTEALRQMLQSQGVLACRYRQLARRGGKMRMLYEQKEAQIACLRGLLRVRTGQAVAHPAWTEGKVDLLQCYQKEQEFLRELTAMAQDPVFAALQHQQARQCCLLLEILGSM